MAKRYTDSNKWKKPWFRRLRPVHKCFWEYVRDNCDHAGIWDVDFDLASYHIGEEINALEAMEAFRKQYIPFAVGKRWFILDFVEFQYGELNPNVNAHSSVISILRRNGLWDAYQARYQAERDIESESNTVKSTSNHTKTEKHEGLNNPSGGDQDKDKDQDIFLVLNPDSLLQDEDKDSIASDVPKESIQATKLTLLKAEFDLARKAYPGTRRGLDAEWDNFKKKFSPADIVPLLMPAIERGKDYRAGCASVNAWCEGWGHFQTWINQSRWTTEYGAIPAPKAKVGFGAPPATEEQLQDTMDAVFSRVKGKALGL